MRDFNGIAGNIQIHEFAGVSDEGFPQLAIGDAKVEAQSLVPLSEIAVSAKVAVATLDDGEYLVIGCLQPPAKVVTTDGERTVIKATKTLELRCGKASLKLEADGRITLRGTQLLSRADGQNRVQGAAVMLN